LPHGWQITSAIAKGFGRICTREFDSAQSSSTSAIETNYANTSDTISDRLQDIFHQDDDDLDELDDEPPSRDRRRVDVFDTVRLDDDIERDDTRSSSRSYRYSYFRDRERDPNNRVSSPRPLSDFNVIEVDGKLSISIDELIAARIIFNDKL
jgi:hypothetical protein